MSVIKCEWGMNGCWSCSLSRRICIGGLLDHILRKWQHFIISYDDNEFIIWPFVVFVAFFALSFSLSLTLSLSLVQSASLPSPPLYLFTLFPKFKKTPEKRQKNLLLFVKNVQYIKRYQWFFSFKKNGRLPYVVWWTRAHSYVDDRTGKKTSSHMKEIQTAKNDKKKEIIRIYTSILSSLYCFDASLQVQHHIWREVIASGLQRNRSHASVVSIEFRL